MKIIKKTIYDDNKNEVGAILIGYPKNTEEVKKKDDKIFKYTYDTLYPDDDVYYFTNHEVAIAIKKINFIQEEEFEI